MHDREFLQHLEKLIKQHLCDHREQYMPTTANGFSLTICKFCGKVLVERSN